MSTIQQLNKKLKELSQLKIEVGVFEGAKYPDGKSVAKVAKDNEFGTSKIPARPAFRNAIFKNRGKWNKILIEQLKSDKDADKSLQTVGVFMVGDIQQEITNTTTPPNAPMTIKKKKSSHPLIDTGFLRASVASRVVKNV